MVGFHLESFVSEAQVLQSSEGNCVGMFERLEACAELVNISKAVHECTRRAGCQVCAACTP